MPNKGNLTNDESENCGLGSLAASLGIHSNNNQRNDDCIEEYSHTDGDDGLHHEETRLRKAEEELRAELAAASPSYSEMYRRGQEPSKNEELLKLQLQQLKKDDGKRVAEEHATCCAIL
jgi:hypothetical protein